MAPTPSTILALGTELPSFSLPGLDGAIVSDSDLTTADALIVAFLCPHCPFVRHVRRGFAQLAAEYALRNVATIGINSNDVVAYPEDDVAGMKREAEAAGYTFPYLWDDDQRVARAFHAACTPDFFVFDRQRRLVYRGQMDGSRPNTSTPVTGADLRRALEALLSGHPVPREQPPSVGCGIKWKPGTATDMH